MFIEAAVLFISLATVHMLRLVPAMFSGPTMMPLPPENHSPFEATKDRADFATLKLMHFTTSVKCFQNETWYIDHDSNRVNEQDENEIGQSGNGDEAEAEVNVIKQLEGYQREGYQLEGKFNDTIAPVDSHPQSTSITPPKVRYCLEPKFMDYADNMGKHYISRHRDAVVIRHPNTIPRITPSTLSATPSATLSATLNLATNDTDSQPRPLPGMSEVHATTTSLTTAIPIVFTIAILSSFAVKFAVKFAKRRTAPVTPAPAPVLVVYDDPERQQQLAPYVNQLQFESAITPVVFTALDNIGTGLPRPQKVPQKVLYVTETSTPRLSLNNGRLQQLRDAGHVPVACVVRHGEWAQQLNRNGIIQEHQLNGLVEIKYDSNNKLIRCDDNEASCSALVDLIL